MVNKNVYKYHEVLRTNETIGNQGAYAPVRHVAMGISVLLYSKISPSKLFTE